VAVARSSPEACRCRTGTPPPPPGAGRTTPAKGQCASAASRSLRTRAPGEVAWQPIPRVSRPTTRGKIHSGRPAHSSERRAMARAMKCC
jgi:hypothetical protein